MEKFLENFKNQLEDPSLNLTPQTDYVNSDFWDSLTAVTVQMMIEDEYGVNIEINKLAEFKSLEELYSFVTENR